MLLSHICGSIKGARRIQSPEIEKSREIINDYYIGFTKIVRKNNICSHLKRRREKKRSRAQSNVDEADRTETQRLEQQANNMQCNDEVTNTGIDPSGKPIRYRFTGIESVEIFNKSMLERIDSFNEEYIVTVGEDNEINIRNKLPDASESFDMVRGKGLETDDSHIRVQIAVEADLQRFLNLGYQRRAIINN